MTTIVRATIFPLGCAALASLLACNAGGGASPSPSPTETASPSPASCAGCPAREGRWGVIVAYQDSKGACNTMAIAGPPRIGACRGEDVTWRAYNRCRTDQTARLTDFVRLTEDPGVPGPEEEGYREKQPSPATPGDPNGPFVDGTVSVTVKPGAAADLKLKVRDNAEAGVYTYVTRLGRNPDADQQIEIWP